MPSQRSILTIRSHIALNPGSLTRVAFRFALIFAIANAIPCRTSFAQDEALPPIPANLFGGNIDRREHAGLFADPNQPQAAPGSETAADSPDKLTPHLPIKSASSSPAGQLLVPNLLSDAQLPQTFASELTQTWRDDADLRAVHFLDAKSGWVVGDQGVIWHTTDGGQTWTRQTHSATAGLNSVCFVDPQNGWAAGRAVNPYHTQTAAVLLRTQDAGRTWVADQRQLLPGLHSLQFVDRVHGWAAGDYSHIFGTSLFLTNDGGREWTPIQAEISGELCAATAWTERFDRQAAIDGANESAASAKNWGTNVPRSGNSATIPFRPQFHAATAKQCWSGEANRLRPVDSTSFGLRRPRAMTTAPSGRAWLVGDGGLIMHFDPQARFWQRPAALPALTEMTTWDWRCVTTWERHVWIAGSPGDRVLHSSDEGATWEWLATEQTLPLYSLSFVDVARGWGVGALGTIIATGDGGKTWQIQRGQNRRAAIWIVVSEPHEIPWEFLAQYSLADGYHCIVTVLNRRDIELPDAAAQRIEERTRTAVASFGAHLAPLPWAFPLRQPGIELPPEALRQLWTNTAEQECAAAVRQFWERGLRTWRPSLVILPPIPKNEADVRRNPAMAIFAPALLELAPQLGQQSREPSTAADNPATLPQEFRGIWSCDRSHRAGLANVNPQQIAPRQTQTLEELSRVARRTTRTAAAHAGFATLTPKPQFAVPQNWSMALIRGEVVSNTASGDLFLGERLPVGEGARRNIVTSSITPERWAELRQTALRRRHWEKILSQGELLNQAMWLSQLNELTTAADPAEAGELLWQLAERLQQAGQNDFARQTLLHLTDKYPRSPAAGMAWQLLLTRETSTEWRRFTNRNGPALANQQRQTSGAALELKQWPPPASAQQEVIPAALNESNPISKATHQQVTKLTTILERQHPLLSTHPRTRLQLAAWWRTQPESPALGQRTSNPRSPSTEIARLLRQPSEQGLSSWSAAAAAELAAQTINGAPATLKAANVNGSVKNAASGNVTTNSDANNAVNSIATPGAIWSCPHAIERPYLDGALDDAVWQQSEPIPMRGGELDSALSPATARFAIDEEFLYLAVECPWADTARPAAADAARPRDPPLQLGERVEWTFDTDRDAATWFRISGDPRAWVSDDMTDDPNWNPKYYAAGLQSNQVWTLEIAIPLVELTDREGLAQQVWRVNVRRIVPHLGAQAAQLPASVQPCPESWGLLRLNETAKKPTKITP